VFYLAGLKKRKDYLVHSYEVDRYNRLTLEKMVNYAQDIAMIQGEELGIGQTHLESKNVAWVVSRFDIAVKRYPAFNEVITIETQPVGFHRLLADRTFNFYDAEGNAVVTINSQWAMVDAIRGRIKKIDDYYPKAYDFDFDDNIRIKYDKVDSVEYPDYGIDIRACNGDIDFNRHVNNGKYLGWVTDSMPFEMLSTGNVKRVNIAYKKEALLGERIKVEGTLPKGKDLHSTHQVCLENGEILALIECKWEKAEFNKKCVDRAKV
jgi:medium-chain acyl-[acyl-carrier-protein] hydrolase